MAKAKMINTAEKTDLELRIVPPMHPIDITNWPEEEKAKLIQEAFAFGSEGTIIGDDFTVIDRSINNIPPSDNVTLKPESPLNVPVFGNVEKSIQEPEMYFDHIKIWTQPKTQ